jgi:DNA-binding MarR family transcriptional regulator
MRPANDFNPHSAQGGGLGYLITQARNAVLAAIESELAPLDVTAAQFIVVLSVAHGRANTPSEIARLVGCDSGAMTRLLDRIEGKGIIRRIRSGSTADRRSVHILHHPLIVLAKLIDWNAIDQVAYEAMGARHHRPPLRPRLVADLLYLQPPSTCQRSIHYQFTGLGTTCPAPCGLLGSRCPIAFITTVTFDLAADGRRRPPRRGCAHGAACAIPRPFARHVPGASTSCQSYSPFPGTVFPMGFQTVKQTGCRSTHAGRRGACGRDAFCAVV